MPRLFVAIPVDEPFHDEVRRVQLGLDTCGVAVKWSRPEQLHVTVKFLGDVRREQVPDVCSAVQRVASAASPFDMQVGGTGCFPPRGAVRIVWLGGADDSGSLTAVVEGVEAEMAALGFVREDRTFSIHFTIGRVKSDGSHGRLRSTVEGFPCPLRGLRVEDMVLFESTLSPTGAKYTSILRAPLGG